MLTSGTCRDLVQNWQFIIGDPIEGSTGFTLTHSAPLLEEERHFELTTLLFQRSNPFGLHGASTSTALTAYDHPVDVAKVENAQILQ